MALALGIAGLDAIFPGYGLRDWIEQRISLVDFNQTLMQGMLAFLLFAGALQIDTQHLKRGRRDILILAILSAILSTLIIGFILDRLTTLMGINMSFAWCLVFGALISPTDAVSAMNILHRLKAPPTMTARIAGESLFNDGTGVVLFSVAVAAAVDHQNISVGLAVEQFLIKAVGGGIFGYITGWLAFRSMRQVDDPHIENMITLALVMGGYALADELGLSPIIAMAVAGVVIARYGLPHGTSDISRSYIVNFWMTIDEILNSVLFVLIGLQVIIVLQGLHHLSLALYAVPLVLFARLVSVSVPLAFKSLFKSYDKGTFPILIWGGMRGGISIALAFSLPESRLSETVQMMTYAVVLFSVVVQGGTLKYLLRHYYPSAS